MNFHKFLRGLLRDPNPEGAGGGGEGAESHDAAADALFGGDSTPSGATTPTPEAKPEGTAPAKTSDEKGGAKPAPSPFGKFGTKPAAAQKPADTAPTTIELPEDKIALGDKANGDTRKHFESLKGITKGLRTDLTARETRIKELEAKVSSGTAMPADYEKLKGEHKAFSDRLSVLDLQNHPDFVKRFGEPKTKIVNEVNSVLADNGVTGVEISSLLGRTRPEFAKAVSEIAAKLPAFEQQAFLSDMRQLYTLDGEAKSELGRAGELSVALGKKTEAAQRQTFDDTWKSLDFAGGLTPFEIPADASPEDRASYEAYNKSVAEIRPAAEAIAFGRMDEKGAALVASKAATFDFMRTHALPRMEAEYERARTMIADLTKEISALKASRRSGNGGGGGGGAVEDESHEVAAGKVFSR